MKSDRERRKLAWRLDQAKTFEKNDLRKRVLQAFTKDKSERTLQEIELLKKNSALVSQIETMKRRRLERRLVRDERNLEKEDPPDELEAKLCQLAKLVQAAASEGGGVVVHTGAGLSTAAGIPDFRGPRGVWTLQEKGQAVQMQLRYEEAIPTEGHMVLAELVRQGFVKHIVTQNVDGLHTRSGVAKDRLSELHGCVYQERCQLCKALWLRPFDVTSPQGSSFRRHKTGRLCTALDHPGRPELLRRSKDVDPATKRMVEDCSPPFVIMIKEEASREARREEEGKLQLGSMPAEKEEVEEGEAWHTRIKADLENLAVPVSCHLQYKEFCDVPHGRGPAEVLAGSGDEEEAPASGALGADGKQVSVVGSALGLAACEAAESGGACGGQLEDTIVHFGERINPDELTAASAASKSAGLAIVLGSSLKVPPANSLVCLARRLVIINLQWTVKDKYADLKIHARADTALLKLAEILQVAVPRYLREKDPLLPFTGHRSKSQAIGPAGIPDVVTTNGLEQDDPRHPPRVPPLDSRGVGKKPPHTAGKGFRRARKCSFPRPLLAPVEPS